MTWPAALESLAQDLRSAWRGVTRAPTVTAPIVGLLALGLGVNSALFSLIDTLYLRPPIGVPKPEALHGVWLQHFRTPGSVWASPRETSFYSQSVSYPEYRAISDAVGSPNGLALYSTAELPLGDRRDGRKVQVVYASASYFSTIGVGTVLGRVYGPDEDRLGQGSPVAVIGAGFWRRHFGADPSVIGQEVTLARQRFTVIGVLDPEFTGLGFEADEVWLPLGILPTPAWMKDPWWTTNHFGVLHAVGRWPDAERLATDGERATQALQALPSEPNFRMDKRTRVVLASSNPDRRPGSQRSEQVIATRADAVATVILVIAIANVVNLLLARAIDRRHDIAVRLALGLSRGRLIRLLVMESIMLALLSSAAALFIADLGGAMIRALLFPDVSWAESALDWRVSAFTFTVAFGAGLVAGLAPAAQVSRPVLTGALKAGTVQGGRGRGGLRHTLVLLQVALAVALLMAAGLFVQSLENVRSLALGFDVSRLAFGSVTFDDGAKPPDATLLQLNASVESRLRGSRAIDMLARSSMSPMNGFSVIQFYAGADSLGSDSTHHATSTQVSPSYFRTVGLDVVRGTTFSSTADSLHPEVVVNEEMARRFWPGQDPIGKCLFLRKRDAPCAPVVGVVADSRLAQVIEPNPEPQFYVPLGAAWSAADAVFIVRARSGSVSAASRELAVDLRETFPDAYPSVTTMSESLEWQYRPWHLGAVLFAAFALLALTVTLAGVFSSVSYEVRQRTHEFGVRAALGAGYLDLTRQVVVGSLRIVGTGVLVGFGLARLAGKALATMLYGIGPNDPLTLLAVGTLLLAAAALASLVPAHRAAHSDPMAVLREE